MTKFYFSLWMVALTIALPIQAQLPEATHLDPGFLSVTNGHSRASLKTQGTQDAPTLYYTFVWNSQTASWDSTWRTELAYVPNTDWDTLKVSYQKVNGNWTNAEKSTKEYNPDGQITNWTELYWDGSAWVVDNINEYTFDQNGSTTERIYASNIGGQLDTLIWYRYTNTYDTQNKLVMVDRTFFDSQNQTWDNNQRTVHTYNPNGELMQTLLLEWSGNSWDSTYRYGNYVWEDYSSLKYLERTLEEYVNGGWVLDSKDAFDWQPNESFDRFILDYNTNTQTFDSSFRILNILNSNGDLEADHFLIYNSGWNLTTSSSNFTNVYNGSNMLSEVIEESYDTNTGVFSNRYKYVYLSYAVGVEEALPSGRLDWAPHPVGQQAVLHLETPFRGGFALKIFDLQGKAVRNFALEQFENAQRHSLELDLEPGYYIYQTEMGNQSLSGRLLVR